MPTFALMRLEETPRQKKIATAIQQELAAMLQGAVRKQGVSNLVLSITKVNVTVDLSLAKVYLSIFPKDKGEMHLKGIQENAFQIKHDMATRMRNQLRKMPELTFYLDDSLDYVEGIKNAINKPENPLKDAKLLSKRQKK
jgi:ribosome-binding factor A|tara:strand:- start:1236 stop:1655 length:420 start_codon:yes stop_codon:yes gene_type:complete